MSFRFVIAATMISLLVGSAGAGSLDFARIKTGMTVAEAQSAAARSGGKLTSTVQEPFVFRIEGPKATPLFYTYPKQGGTRITDEDNLRIYLIEGNLYDRRFEQPPIPSNRQALEVLLDVFGAAELDLKMDRRFRRPMGPMVFEPARNRILRTAGDVAAAYVSATAAAAAGTTASSSAAHCVALPEKLGESPRLFSAVVSAASGSARLGNPMPKSDLARMLSMYDTGITSGQAYADSKFGAGTAATASACGTVQTIALTLQPQIASADEFLARSPSTIFTRQIDYRELFMAYDSFRALAREAAR